MCSGLHFGTNARITSTGAGATAGTITLTGKSSLGGTSATNMAGVFFENAGLRTIGGNISVIGTAKIGTMPSDGVLIKSASSLIESTGVGTIAITGITSAATTVTAIGVNINDSAAVTGSGSGTVAITGSTEASTSDAIGVSISGSATVNASSSGDLTISGSNTAAASTGAGTSISTASVNGTSSGNITVAGTSSSTTSGPGIIIESTATIAATGGSGNVTVTGSTPSSTGSGISLINASSIRNTGTGIITITGTSSSTTGTGSGFSMDSSTAKVFVETNTTDITVNGISSSPSGNGLTMINTASITTNSGIININCTHPATSGASGVGLLTSGTTNIIGTDAGIGTTTTGNINIFTDSATIDPVTISGAAPSLLTIGTLNGSGLNTIGVGSASGATNISSAALLAMTGFDGLTLGRTATVSSSIEVGTATFAPTVPITIQADTIILGGGTNLNANDLTATIGLSTTGVFNISGTVTGASGTNTLTGTGAASNNIFSSSDSGAHTWSITGDNAGTYTNTTDTYSVGFSTVGSLSGGPAVDAFAFTGAFQVIGISGGSGLCNTLTGPNVVNAWSITSDNVGTLTPTGATGATSFTNIGTLIGGTAADTMLVGRNNTMTGQLDGGAPIATNTLDYSLWTFPTNPGVVSFGTTGTANNLNTDACGFTFGWINFGTLIPPPPANTANQPVTKLIKTQTTLAISQFSMLANAANVVLKSGRSIIAKWGYDVFNSFDLHGMTWGLVNSARVSYAKIGALDDVSNFQLVPITPGAVPPVNAINYVVLSGGNL